MSNHPTHQTRQQRRAEERRARKQATSVSVTTPTTPKECLCGIADPTTAPDIKAFRHIEYGITDDATLHEVISARNRLADVHNALVSIAGRGVDLLDDITRDQTGEALVMLDQMINVDPAEAAGYADLGDPEEYRKRQRVWEKEEEARWYEEQDHEMVADHAYATYAAGRD